MTDLDLVALLDPLLVRLADLIAERVKGNGNGHASPEEDRLLTVEQAAKRLATRARWIYAHRAQLPFVVQMPGSRALRCSARGIERWLARRQG